MTVVLDASALLAYLYAEDGAETVSDQLDDAGVSSVNWSEALQKVAASGGDAGRIADGLVALGVMVHPFSAAQARIAAAMWPRTRSAGLSLGDRACLALGHDLGIPVLTADRPWKGVDIGVDVRLIR